MQFVGGVTAVQLRAMTLEEDGVAVSPAGAEGTALQLPPLVCVVAEACAEGPDDPSASNASTT